LTIISLYAKVSNMKAVTESTFYTFRVIIEPDEPSGYHGFAPLLKGVHTQGESIDEVKKNLKEAIVCHIQGLVKDNEQIPMEGDALETITSVSSRELALL
jgi:predicted RNase H-like HicB family nuclease